MINSSILLSHRLPYVTLDSLLSPTLVPGHVWIHAHVSWRATALQYSLLHMLGRRASAKRPHRQRERERERPRKESNDLSSFRIPNCPPNINKLSYQIILRVIDITTRIPSWMHDSHRWNDNSLRFFHSSRSDVTHSSIPLLNF